MKPRIMLLLIAALALTAACAKKDADAGDTTVVPAKLDTGARAAPRVDSVDTTVRIDTSKR